NQITQELSGSAEPNPSPSSVSSGLTTPTSTATSASTPLPTILTLTIGGRTGDENELSGNLRTSTVIVVGAVITFTGTDKDGSIHPIVDSSGTPLADITGHYHTAASSKW
ncbi:MAG TPA: hypothetical protein VE843_13135, partial [Ktedonobacteraceae bacterium]|nr:hypothetical protein [Ktedonobacteraceae bacterium]